MGLALLLALVLNAPVTAPVARLADHAPLPRECRHDRCVEQLADPAADWKIDVFRNVPLSGSAQVTRAVVVLHGTGRNAKGYFSSMLSAAEAAGADGRTLVVAPWFKTSEDDPGPGEARWTDDSWKDGGDAVSPRGLSSFTVMDRLVSVLADKQRFPNLNHITVAGHSAGGQFTQRYAVFGQGPNTARDVSFNYVPANPSSYVYFGPSRPTTSGFAVPAMNSCPNYDDYKYGMLGRSGYVSRLSAAQALTAYASRRVTILNGGADTFDNGDLDSDCAAMLEGNNRASRGANYARYIRAVAPAAPQTRIVVPGVDHDSDAMFSSPLARAALFGDPGSV